MAVDAELAGDFTLLLEQNDKYGEYAWRILSNTLCYAAELVPEVNESLVAVDDAMKLGYNWIQGPFEMIDAIGVDNFVARLEKEGRAVPEFVRTALANHFIGSATASCSSCWPTAATVTLRSRRLIRFSEQRRTLTAIEENDAASYFDLGNNVGLIEFHSKANALGPRVDAADRSGCRACQQQHDGLDYSQ